VVWRTSYQTRELDPTPTPALVAEALNGDIYQARDRELLVGGFDLRAQSEIGVWNRIFDEELPCVRCWTVFFLDSLTPKVAANLRAMIPRSKHDKTLVCTQPESWASIIQPDRPERSFGTLITEGVADPLMVGIPTEEALDRFLEKLGSLRE